MTISLTFPDGAVREYEAGVSPAEIAASISKSLSKKAMIAKIDGRLADMSEKIHKDASIAIITPSRSSATMRRM